MLTRILKERERRSVLFGEMRRRFSLEPERDLTMSDAILLSRAINRCIACGAADRCERWMSDTEAADGAEDFCPNAAAFRTLSGV